MHQKNVNLAIFSMEITANKLMICWATLCMKDFNTMIESKKQIRSS